MKRQFIERGDFAWVSVFKHDTAELAMLTCYGFCQHKRDIGKIIKAKVRGCIVLAIKNEDASFLREGAMSR